MEKILQQQSEIGQEAERMWTNFKKDPSVRKTAKYLDERLNKLEEYWAKFKDNHEIIEESADIDKNHAYYQQNFYNGVFVRYTEMKNAITQLQQLTSPADNIGKTQDLQINTASTAKSTKITTQPNSDIEASKQTEKDTLIKLVRKQNAIMKNVTHVLEELEPKILEDQPVTYFEYKRDLLLQYATEIRQLDQQIWELATIEEPHGYSSTRYQEMEDWLQDTMIALQIRIKSTMGTKQSCDLATTTSNQIKPTKN